MTTCPYHLQTFLSAVKMENFIGFVYVYFLIFAQNIDCRYTLEPPHRGGSNLYHIFIFWSKNKKNRYAPVYPSCSGIRRFDIRITLANIYLHVHKSGISVFGNVQRLATFAALICRMELVTCT